MRERPGVLKVEQSADNEDHYTYVQFVDNNVLKMMECFRLVGGDVCKKFNRTNCDRTALAPKTTLEAAGTDVGAAATTTTKTTTTCNNNYNNNNNMLKGLGLE